MEKYVYTLYYMYITLSLYLLFFCHLVLSLLSSFPVQSDPFIKLTIGKNKLSDVDNYIPNNLNPLFGRMYEMPATLPLDHTLEIKVMDYDRTSANDLIGETTIDLENRFLTQHRAICGLPETFAK